MHDLQAVAPAFVHMAHSIVWCTVASVDRFGRPRSRILHPMWNWNGAELVGWVAIQNTQIMQEHVEHTPYVSCSYWSDSHDTCAAECRAEMLHDDATRIEVWNKFKDSPLPLGYDPAWIEHWTGPTDDAFAVLRLEPWRLRVFPGAVLFDEDRNSILNWRREPVRL